jgi:Aspartyl protease
MHLPGGIDRPIIAVAIEGPTGKRLLDGLVDTGSDRTLFPHREAKSLGISLPAHPDGWIKTAGGVSIPYRMADIVLELRASGSSVRWGTPVGFAEDPLSLIHLGYHGFLEYFHCTFRGPEKTIRFDPRPNLPAP